MDGLGAMDGRDVVVLINRLWRSFDRGFVEWRPLISSSTAFVGTTERPNFSHRPFVDNKLWHDNWRTDTWQVNYYYLSLRQLDRYYSAPFRYFQLDQRRNWKLILIEGFSNPCTQHLSSAFTLSVFGLATASVKMIVPGGQFNYNN